MTDEDWDNKCLRCGQPLDFEEQDRDASFCALCAAALDAELDAEDARIEADLDQASDDGSVCATCGEPLSLAEQERGASFCASCGALLDEELGSPLSSTNGVDGLAMPEGESQVERQQRYSREDHDWNMNHPYWGRNPSDRDP